MNHKKIVVFCMLFFYFFSVGLLPFCEGENSGLYEASIIVSINDTDTTILEKLDAQNLQSFDQLQLNNSIRYIQCSGDKTYALTSTYQFYIIDTDTFEVEYFFNNVADKYKNFLVEGSYIYSSSGSVVYKSNALTGELITSNAISTYIPSNAVARYMGSYGNYLYFVNPSKKLISVLKTDLSAVLESAYALSATTNPYVIHPSEYGVFVSDARYIRVFNLTDLSLNWSLISPNTFVTPKGVFYENNELFIGWLSSSTEYPIRVYNVTDRSILRTTSGSHNIYTMKADSNNFYTLDDKGYIRKFSKDTMINTFGYNNAGVYSFGLSYLDVFEGPMTEPNSIIFRFLDSYTGASFDAVYSPGYAGPWPLGYDRIFGDVSSDLWSGFYTEWGYFPATLSISFSEGSFHTFTFTNLTGYIDDLYYEFENLSVTLKLYSGQTFYVVFQRKGGTPGFNHCDSFPRSGFPEGWPDGGWPVSICTDKAVYEPGETISIRYYLPSVQALSDSGMSTSGYSLCMVRDPPGTLFAPGTGDATVLWDVYTDGLYHTLSYNPPDPDDNIDRYYFYIVKDGWWIFHEYLFPISNNFIVTVIDTASTFTPSGNITAVSPSEPYIGQNTGIIYDVNNNWRLRVHHTFDTPGIYELDTNGEKFIGSRTQNWQPLRAGIYSITLEISNGLNYTVVDDVVVYVNATGDSPGEFGYNAEFLYVPYRRAIAGHDRVNVIYKTLKGNNATLINIVDPTGARTPYSMYVNGTGNFTITLPSYAEIGTWNITMNATETLYESFNVIAEEGNWIEFTKNVYYDTEEFSVIILHNKKVAITFYREGVAMGSTVILERDNISNGVVTIPRTTVAPSAGSWTVEMWEVNNLIRIKKLAIWEAIVIVTPGTDPGDGTGDIRDLIPSEYYVYVGFGIIIGFLLLPFMVISRVVAGMKRTKGVDIRIPATVYTVSSSISGITGYAIDIFFGFLEWWTVFILVFILGLVAAIMYLMKNKSEG